MEFGYLVPLWILPLLATAFRVLSHAKKEGSLRISIWDCAKDQFLGITIYGLFGPLLGFAPFGLFLVAIDGKFQHIWLLIPLSMFSYPVGGVPALATGAIVGAIKPWLWGWRALGVSSAIGAVLTLTWVFAAGYTERLGGVLLFSACGAVGGLVCARMWFGRPGKADP